MGVIPAQIGRLSDLVALELWSNIIEEYAPELATLAKLEKLDLLNNQMTISEQEMVKTFLPNTEIILSPPCDCSFD